MVKKPSKRIGAKKPATKLPAKTISLVLIDDNRLLQEGIAALIDTQPGFRVLVASADADEAMEKVREAKPDVVLLDIGLVDHDSIALTHTVHTEVPSARVIVMGLLPAQEDVAEYVQAGASGFIMKDASFEDFFATIRAMAGGEQVLPGQLTHSLFTEIVEKVAKVDKAQVIDAVLMTTQELEVIDLQGKGMSNPEIAAELNIALHVVKSHMNNVLEKLALHSRLEVIAFTHPTGGTDRPPA